MKADTDMKRQALLTKEIGRMRSATVRQQRGFTLIELAIATVVLLVGVIAVMQLVPQSMRTNLANRQDTTSVVIAQRLLDQMITQPLDVTTFNFVEPNGALIAVISTGNPANGVYGGPVQNVNNRARINFNLPAVGGFNFQYTDPNDPQRAQYEVRWAVVVDAPGGLVQSKRYIVGVRTNDRRNPLLPVTVEGWVQR
jgi:prepilin-type N-terminal cleavage/methylation domain-containing protein